jgi:hypothetical protein
MRRLPEGNRLTMEILFDALTDAFIDSVKMIPLLLVIYVLIEFFEVKFGNRMGRAVARAGKAGPAIGTVAGVIPQCGVSVIGTALYTQRLVTIGTLFAIYLATSDEAIPVILSQPDRIGVLLPLIAVKIVVALFVGYAMDFAFRKRNAQIFTHVDQYLQGEDEAEHHHEKAFEEQACCGHAPSAPDQQVSFRTLLVHPLIHTLKVFVFIFAVSFALSLVFALVGQDAIADALAGQTILQPFAAALIGLIPNCAASVAITEFYLSGVITFGATVAGLCASGGLGILVLLKEDARADALKIIGGLFLISVAVGLLIELVGW